MGDPVRGSDRLRFLLVTGGGLGLAPVASGTVGTLGGVALALPLQLVCAGGWLAAALAALALVLLAAGCSTTAFVGRTFRSSDPKPFVLDEIVGYLVTVSIYTALHGDPDTFAHVMSFFFFRLFDVLKLYPANRLEMLPGAPGVMLDDVAAGVQAGAGVAVAAWVLQA